MRTLTIEKTVYPFEELSSKAKARVCDWYREGLDDFADFTIEDFRQVCELIGIDLRTRNVKLMNGSTRPEPCVYWQLAYSQGDGASFEGTYTYRKGASKAIRQHAPQDTRLHAIVDALQAVQARWFYKLSANCRDSRCCLLVDVEHADDQYRSIDRNTEREISDQLDRLASWLYEQLRSEYEHQTSEETVAEMCESNDWEFDESGRIHR
ncbi:antitoxin of toxin-antitoxin stability system [Rhodanobacter sp. 115]|uniref:antitoxin of toxin-antitoxin stability system n=1 Tax=Rhodanobacter sp. FW021-MT20 TaxID=1162282 RepID=UPI0034E523C4